MAAKQDENSFMIDQNQRRRADNQIWNAAGIYDFVPKLRAYDREGNAQLYWNSVIGAVEKYFGSDLDPLWEAIHKAIAEDLCSQLVWIGLEQAVFEREALVRPAFPLLRRTYARELLNNDTIKLPAPYDEVYRLHFEKAAGRYEEDNFDIEKTDRDDQKKPENLEAAGILSRLEFSGDLSGEELAREAIRFLDERTLLLPKEDPVESGLFRIRLPFGLGRKKGQSGPDSSSDSGEEKNYITIGFKRKKKTPPLSSIRSFGSGIGEYAGESEEDTGSYFGRHGIWDLSEKQNAAAMAEYVHNIFGSPLYTQSQVEKLERTLCTGDHEGCRLWCAKGDDWTNPKIQGYATGIRRQAIKQMGRNYDYYEKHKDEAHIAIRRLTEKWNNAFLTYRQDSAVVSDSGRLCAVRTWRAEKTDDRRIFDHIVNADSGDFYVDILLDASYSQEERQPHVALQGYIIAEALTRCHIPVRVCSFSSLGGYTVLTRYRDYKETGENQQIFHYTTFGGNRDGLAIKLIGHLMQQNAEQSDHRILIVLSDAKPNDAVNIRTDGVFVPYKGAVSIDNTAKEIRFLRNRGIAVLCVFTGTDDDLPAVHQIYNRDFVRIRSFDHFAQAVGNLMLTQLRTS